MTIVFSPDLADLASLGVAYIIRSFTAAVPSIYTVDSKNRMVECALVVGKLFLAVGSYEDVGAHAYYVPGMQELRIPQGAIVIPGIIDAHGHFLELGMHITLSLDGARTIKEAVELVAAYIRGNPKVHDDKDLVIYGGGWDNDAFDGFPTTEHLEANETIRGRMVVLQSKDCHAYWVSRAVLDRVSLPANLEIQGGEIKLDNDRRPTGVLLDNAQDLVDKKLPEILDETLRGLFDTACDNALRHGITTIHDAGLHPRSLGFYKKLLTEERSAFKIRIYAMHYFDAKISLEEFLQKLDESGPKTFGLDSQDEAEENGRLSCMGVKFFADGAVRTEGAAMSGHSYKSCTHGRGFMKIQPEVLKKVVPAVMKKGWQTASGGTDFCDDCLFNNDYYQNVHAIGDLACKNVVDTFEVGLSQDRDLAQKLRPRMEHAQIIREDDAKRLGELGIIASIQPSHLLGEIASIPNKLDESIHPLMYPFRTLIDNGVRVALGTDFPVEDISPFKTMYAALTRTALDGKLEPFTPEHCLTPEETLRGMTYDGAYASFTEKYLGSIEVGKYADFVILNQDPMKMKAQGTPKKILETKVLATFVDGKAMYEMDDE